VTGKARTRAPEIKERQVRGMPQKGAEKRATRRWSTENVWKGPGAVNGGEKKIVKTGRDPLKAKGL